MIKGTKYGKKEVEGPNCFKFTWLPSLFEYQEITNFSIYI